MGSRSLFAFVSIAIVSCSGGETPSQPPPLGNIQVTTSTSGADVDPDGYNLMVNGSAHGSMPVTGAMTVSDLPAGASTIELRGVAANCVVGGQNPRTVSVVAGSTVQERFTVTCTAIPPATGTVEVTTVTTGSDLDPDGYTFTIGAGSPTAIAINDTVQVTGVAIGSRTVTLAGVAGNCSVIGGLSRSVSVTAGATASAAFSVSCAPTTGAIEVITTTAGNQPDPDGYTLTIDGGAALPLAVNTIDTVTALSPGNRSVVLGDVATNCTVAGQNPRQVAVVAGQIASTMFQVNCPEVGTAAVTVLTQGLSLDPNGYQVGLDGGSAVSVLGSGSTWFDNLPVGNHTLAVSGIAGNCSLAGPNPLTFAVTIGDTTAVSVIVNCTLVTGPRAGQVIFRKRTQISNSPPVFEYDVYTMNSDGSGVSPFLTGPDFQDRPMWSPDGQRVVYEYRASSSSPPSVRVINADGTGDTDLGTGGMPAWSPDGTEITYIDNGIWIMSADGSNVRRLFPVSGMDNSLFPVWSPDGSRIAFRNGGGGIDVMFVDGKGRQTVSPSGVVAERLAWSPDGTKLAFSQCCGFQNSKDVFLMSIDGTGLTTLVGDAADEENPTWSPDGTQLIFDWNLGGDTELYRINADGTGRVQLLTSPGHDENPRWGR